MRWCHGSGRGVEVSSEVLQFLAQQAPSNIRELEGPLNLTIAFSPLLRAEITVDLAVEALATVSSQPIDTRIGKEVRGRRGEKARDSLPVEESVP